MIVQPKAWDMSGRYKAIFMSLPSCSRFFEHRLKTAPVNRSRPSARERTYITKYLVAYCPGLSDPPPRLCAPIPEHRG